MKTQQTHVNIPCCVFYISLSLYTRALNPLQANFFRRNIYMYLHLMSFLHIDTTQVVEIIPHVKEKLAYST